MEVEEAAGSVEAEAAEAAEAAGEAEAEAKAEAAEAGAGAEAANRMPPNITLHSTGFCTVLQALPTRIDWK